MAEETSTAEAVETTLLTEGTDNSTDQQAGTENDESTLLGKDEETTKEETTKSTVPEKYEFKVPEGMELDVKLVDTFSPVFKELGLSNEQAQKLVDNYAPFIKAQAEAQKQAALDSYKEMVGEWKTETTKELGADAQKIIALAGKAINKFGTPALRELLNETGVGNHIELVKFFANVGKSISEDTFPDSSKKSTGGDVSLYDHPTSRATLVK